VRCPSDGCSRIYRKSPYVRAHGRESCASKIFPREDPTILLHSIKVDEVRGLMTNRMCSSHEGILLQSQSSGIHAQGTSQRASEISRARAHKGGDIYFPPSVTLSGCEQSKTDQGSEGAEA
jgi:hypothetical protein